MKKIARFLWSQIKNEVREAIVNLIVRVLLIFLNRIQENVRNAVIYLPGGNIDVVNSPLSGNAFLHQIRLLQSMTNPDDLKKFVNEVVKDSDLDLLK